MSKWKNLILLLFCLVISFNLGALAKVSGKVVSMDGLRPLAGVEVGLIKPADFPEGEFEYSAVTDSEGRYLIEGVREETYIVSAVAWGYNPDYSYSLPIYKDYEGVEIRLVKYTIPSEIDSVDLNIFQKGRLVASLPMRKEGEDWQGSVKVKRGSYSYGFSVNKEKYHYYDLNNESYELINGHISSTLDVKRMGELTVRFSPNIYRRFDYRSMNYEPFDWFICKSYREEQLKRLKPAKEFVIGKLQEKKIVFLSENHSTVNPILFLASILSDLYYQAGLRYLFLEGFKASYKEMLEGDFSNPGASLPWESDALRYQWIELMRAVDQLNSTLPPDSRLKLINAEEGYEDGALNNMDERMANLQAREDYAYKRISRVMSKAVLGEKALIFYGGAHGNKKEYTFFNADSVIKSFSSYIADEYKDDFYSISIDNYSLISGRDGRFRYPRTTVNEFIYLKKYLTKGSFAVEVRESYMNPGSYRINRSRYNGEDYSNYFDGIIFLGEEQYGLPYGYVKSRYTAEKLIDVVKNSKSGFNVNIYNRALYCLKLLAGDEFSYSIWNSPVTLDEAIEQLGSSNYLKRVRKDSNWRIKRKVEYCNYLVSGVRAFEMKNYTDALYYLREAHKFYKDDLYTLYFLFLTNYEMGKMEEARVVGEKLAASQVSYNMVELPDVYNLLANIYEETGNSEKAGEFRERLDNLVRSDG